MLIVAVRNCAINIDTYFVCDINKSPLKHQKKLVYRNLGGEINTPEPR